MSRDAYASFAELAARERAELDYRRVLVARPSPIAIVAPHGGAIEPGTSEVARALAGDEFSLYLFEGLRPGRSAALHITSTRFDDPVCLDLLAATQVAITIHGAAGSDVAIRIGGRDEELGGRIATVLAAARFALRVDADRRLAGVDARNLCNRSASGRGVQLELSAGLRRSLFAGPWPAARRVATPAGAAFVGAVRSELLARGAAIET